MTTLKETSVSPRKLKMRSSRKHKASTRGSAKQNVPARIGTLFFSMLLFCSGAAALVYQALWIKQLSLIVGVEVFSIAVCVSAFFTGLALGGLIFGRWVDSISNPLRLYCKLEAGIALLGITATYLMGHAASLFVTAEAQVGILAWLIPLVLVGLPALVMGGTLPIAISAWHLNVQNVAITGGAVYSLNTAGGIAGTLCGTFFFLPKFGVFGTGVAAAVLNLASAFIAYFLSRASRTKEHETITVEGTAFTREAWVALALYSVAGGIALGYEVVWS
jgi:spermidine synthase